MTDSPQFQPRGFSHQLRLYVLYMSQVYRGYVDDPRNTDNAWMETQVYNFHDDEGTSVAVFRLHAGKLLYI